MKKILIRLTSLILSICIMICCLSIHCLAANASSSKYSSTSSQYYDPNAYIKIKKFNNNAGQLETDLNEIDKKLRKEYSKLFKKIPGYVEGEFDYVTKEHNNLRYKHLTKENAKKIKKLCNNYWKDYLQLDYMYDEYENIKDYSKEVQLTLKRIQIFSFINAIYCAKQSKIGEYSPDGTKYIGKNLDGVCYTKKTELSHLYWIVAPRKFKQLPKNTYCKMEGFSISFSKKKQKGFQDVSEYYVIPGSIPDYKGCYGTVITDKKYRNQWFPSNGGGFITRAPDDNDEYYIT